jgi:hypothetical protein
MAKDNKVPHLRESRIKDIADAWHSALVTDLFCFDFNVVECVREYIRLHPGKMSIQLFDKEPFESPAYVKYDPTILYCDREVWEEAEQNYPGARFILAHEFAHVVLHSYYVQNFSGDLRKSIWQKEESGEWQANTFADYFLVSDHAIMAYVTPTNISIYCNVERDVALRRLGNIEYTGERCDCGSDEVVRRGLIGKCDSCGRITQL